MTYYHVMQARVALPVADSAGRSLGEPARTGYDEIRRLAGRGGRPAVVLPLEPLVAEFTATCGFDWNPVTRRKHAADFARFHAWLGATGRPTTTASFDLPTLAAYVGDLRRRPRVSGVWRGAPGAAERAAANTDGRSLSANTVGSYVRPVRAFAGWLADEGLLPADPFRRARRWASRNPLLPTEETPTKSATLGDIRALERGCVGSGPLELRDRAIVSILVTTAARNSSVRLLLVSDVDFERSIIRFRRAKGAKTLLITLHPEARAALGTYLVEGRPALAGTGADRGFLFPAQRGAGAPLGMNALSLMLTRRYHAGGGTLPYFGSHRIRHATATFLVNNGMPLEEVSRYLGHSSTDVTRRYARHTPETLGAQAADALERAGLVGSP
jgi:integrase/recombinase XerD